MRIVKLSAAFYAKYGAYPEIMQKGNRPYYCLELRLESATYAIPFRHNIQHQYAFHTIDPAGLDYSKAVVISDDSMLSADSVRINTAEWRLIAGHEKEVIAGFLKYLRLYRKAVEKPGIPKYDRIVQYSTLKYFDI